jgi:hypothetical protein
MENENDIIIGDDEQLEEDLDIETTEDVEDDESTDWKAIAEAEKQRRVKAEQAIAKAKATKKTDSKPVEKDLTDFSVERTVLRSLGTSKEEIETLEKLAKLNGTSLVDAKEDPIFKAWKQEFDKKVETEKASLGASRGSRTPSYSPEQQRERFMKNDNPSREEIRNLIHKKK